MASCAQYLAVDTRGERLGRAFQGRGHQAPRHAGFEAPRDPQQTPSQLDQVEPASLVAQAIERTTHPAGRHGHGVIPSVAAVWGGRGRS